MSLASIKDFGKVTIKKLNDLNINNVQDMLLTFPKKYEVNKISSIEEKEINKPMTLEIEVLSPPKVYYIRKKLTKLTFQAKSNNVIFTVAIFNREYMSNFIKTGVFLIVTGKFLKNYSAFSASNLALKHNYSEGIFPIYNLRDITEHRVRTGLNNILNSNYYIEDELPIFLKERHNFIDLNKIIRMIHKPMSLIDVNYAKTRMAYEEFLYFALRIEIIKKLNQRIITPKKEYNIHKVKELIRSLPFELTKDQKQVTNEIFIDFHKEASMNRLLQGDVGSGKTIVAVISAYAVVTACYQVAILAPTLVLAKQHYNTFVNYLSIFGVNIELLTSETTTKDKDKILDNVKLGKADIIIGTHSLLQEGISFKKLGFVVIDEQQRFGVEQRKTIREKGINPDILMMSATPIPRTLAISMFESTEVSVIKEKPSDRKLIKTEIIDFESVDKAFISIQKELNLNRQVYVICPLIQESENRSSISVDEAYKIFSKKFKTAKVDMLHGKMNDVDKSRVLNNFYNNITNILVSTTVVEVGVNVSNASIMVIFNANNFGLAQLHQLRGRIGRNDYPAYCYLIADDLIEEMDRLKILENSNDGFEISEYDLQLRGPGEVFGHLQSGVPNFRFANIITDTKLRDQAFEDAKELIGKDDEKTKKIYRKVLNTIESYNLD